MADPQASVYRFAEFELDIQGRQLIRSGESLAMEPRVFDLLAYLVANRDRAVSKDELQEALWAPMIVTETALTRAVGKARRAVGDDAGQQSMIRTVHGHGYQFVGTLSEPTTAGPAAGTSPEVVDPSTITRPRWVLGFIALAFVAVIGVVLLWPSSPPADGIRLAVMPVQNQTGDAELDWVRYGMMDLANQLFTDNGAVAVVASSDIVKFAENRGWGGAVDADSLADIQSRLGRAYGATHVLIPELERNVGGLRLSYLLVDSGGRRREATMVSEQSASLARGMVQGVTGLLGFRQFDRDDLSVVDEDPFINEAYARAISKVLEGSHAQALPLLDVVLARNPALHLAQLHRAECLFILGKVDESEAAYRELSENPEVQVQPGLHARSLTGLAKVIHETGRLAEAEPIYQQSLAVAEAADEFAEVGRVLISMSILDYDRRDFAAARAKLSRSTLAFDRLEREVLPGQIYASLANIDMNDGRLGDAEDNVNKALESFRAIGDRRNEALMLNNFGYLRRLQGRFDEALGLHEQSLAMRRDLGDRVGQGRILGMLSTLYARDGRFDEAKAAAVESVAIARSANDRIFIATGLAQQAEADRSLGNIDAAREALEESRSVFVGIDDHSRAAQVDLRLAELMLAVGDLETAESQIQAVLTQALSADWPDPAVEAMRYAGDLSLARAELLEAAAWYARGIEHADETGATGSKTTLAVKLANVYLELGRLDDAEPVMGFLVAQESTEEIEAVKSRYRALISTQ